MSFGVRFLRKYVSLLVEMRPQMRQRTTCTASDNEYSHLINNIKNERKRFCIHDEREGGRHQCQ